MRPAAIIIFCLFALVSAGALKAIYDVALRDGLAQIDATAEIRLDQSRDRFLAQLSSYRQIANLLTTNQEIKSFLKSPNTGTGANELLLNTGLSTGAASIHLLDRNATIVAGSDYQNPDSKIGQNLSRDRHIQTALNGALGFQKQLLAEQDGRALVFARAVFDAPGQVIGIVQVSLALEALEFEWNVDAEALVFALENGLVFASNRQALILKYFVPEALKTPAKIVIRYEESNRFGNQLWNIATSGIPKRSLVKERFLPRVGLSARILMDTEPAFAAARLQTYFASAVIGLMGFIGLFVWLRRGLMAERLAVEQAASADLERRVDERTAELRSAQKQLIQAGKLNALGQMSASISHELNQPLAALRNFAENGRKLLQRGRNEEAENNFAHISSQIERISRIIASLRAFARKERETVERVDLVPVISESLNLMRSRMDQESVELISEGLEESAFVNGGTIRLQQVLINLISNALDAMADQPEKRLIIKLHIGQRTSLLVRDNGPGLKDPDRVFEPFYSTKEVGASKGLGLGLAISHGIVGSFGGQLNCRNHPEGGAEFTIILENASESIAA